jgi:hypothetical protein
MIDLETTEIVLLAVSFFGRNSTQQPEIIYYLELRAAKFE